MNDGKPSVDVRKRRPERRGYKLKDRHINTMDDCIMEIYRKQPQDEVGCTCII